MRLLLDTHTLFWALRADRRLSTDAARVIDDPANIVMVSAVSGYEIAFKHRLGKMPEATALVATFDQELAAADYLALPVTAAHAIAAGQLDPFHRDPFDRLLAAQALIERMPVVSIDTVFDRYGVERLW